MLRHLQIRDLAIIDAVELELSGGMTVLSGETGAGKSILVDALELLVGARAGAEWVRPGSAQADLSARFDLPAADPVLRALLEEQSIPLDAELVLRRVLMPDGRSRAWINGRAVPVQLLRAAGERLVDIHGQHEFQSLARTGSQRDLLDAFGGLEPLAAEVRSAQAAWLGQRTRERQLSATASDRSARLELLRYQLRELEALQLQPGEPAALLAERTRLGHSGRLLEAVAGALNCLYEADDAPTAQALLARALGALRPAAGTDARLDPLVIQLEESALGVREAAHGLQQYLEALELDPQRQDLIERRLAAIEELARKHRVGPADLLECQAAIAAELAGVESSAEQLEAAQRAVGEALKRYRALARRLSERRIEAARTLAEQVSARMQQLGMAGGCCAIDVIAGEDTEPAPHGLDRVEFRVQTNPGQPSLALARIASGGELARLSLAVQVSCARQAVACMVFDEVDAGIGGAVAEMVGRELRTLGEQAQVLCVTHLPQVAAQGHRQLRIVKLSDGRTTRISVKSLSEAARVAELARMLGGVEVTARGRAHALEMLSRAAKPAS